MTGMNENTIKVKLFRARQKLLKAAQRLSLRPRNAGSGGFAAKALDVVCVSCKLL